MKAVFEATKPDDIQFSMTIAMSLKDWKELRERVDEKWPGWDFRSKITDMIMQAERQFYPRNTSE